MSDDWPQTGIGTRDHELGSSGPGSPRAKGASKKLLAKWYAAVEPVTFGKPVNTQVAQTRFYKDVKRLTSKNVTDEQLASAFERFAHDIKIGRIEPEGKSLWSLFITVWPRYSKAPSSRAVRQKTSAPSSWAAVRDAKKKKM